MIAEPSLAAFAKVVFHTVTAHGDPGDDPFGTDRLHQFVSVAIRQTEVAHDEIGLHLASIASLDSAVCLILSTVYCRYHYVVDVLAGVILAFGAVPMGDWIYDRSVAGRQTAG